MSGHNRYCVAAAASGSMIWGMVAAGAQAPSAGSRVHESTKSPSEIVACLKRGPQSQVRATADGRGGYGLSIRSDGETRATRWQVHPTPEGARATTNSAPPASSTRSIARCV